MQVTIAPSSSELTYSVIDLNANTYIADTTTSVGAGGGTVYLATSFATVPTTDQTLILQFKRASMTGSNPLVYGPTFLFDAILA